MFVSAAWRIASYKLESVAEKFSKIAKKAQKLGFEPPAFKVAFSRDEETGSRNELSFDDKPRMVNFSYITFQGETPKLAGWTFCGTLEHADEIGVIVRTVPDQNIPSSYYNADPANCDHCKQLRRRTETFILRHDGGTHKQVGRQCVQDFLGGHNPANALSMLQCLSDGVRVLDGEELGDGAGSHAGHYVFNISYVLAVTARAIQAYGWTSRTDARTSGRASTADVVAPFVVNPLKLDKREREKLSPVDRDFELAEKALEWSGNLSEEARLKSEYLQNVHVLSKAGSIGEKHFGLACSIIVAYLREQEKQASAGRESKPDEHFGVVEAKPSEFELRCVHYTCANGFYGLKHIFTFEDEAGRLAVWFGTGRTADDLDYSNAIGKTFKLRAKIKEHGQYNGRKQTILSHLKVCC